MIVSRSSPAFVDFIKALDFICPHINIIKIHFRIHVMNTIARIHKTVTHARVHHVELAHIQIHSIESVHSSIKY